MNRSHHDGLRELCTLAELQAGGATRHTPHAATGRGARWAVGLALGLSMLVAMAAQWSPWSPWSPSSGSVAPVASASATGRADAPDTRLSLPSLMSFGSHADAASTTSNPEACVAGVCAAEPSSVPPNAAPKADVEPPIRKPWNPDAPDGPSPDEQISQPDGSC